MHKSFTGNPITRHQSVQLLRLRKIARNHGQMSNVPIHQELRTIERRGRNSLHGNEFKNFEFSAKRPDYDLCQSETEFGHTNSKGKFVIRVK
jgi:hypothetical protein